MNDWLLGIWGLLLGVGDRGFLFRPHFGASHFVRASRPPTPPQGQLNLPENKNNRAGGRVFMAGVWLSVLYSV